MSIDAVTITGLVRSCGQHSTRKVKMKMFRDMAVNLLLIAGLSYALTVHADTNAIRVYKGELRIIVPDRQTRDSLLIRYRSKSREVVRVGIKGLVLTNTATKEVTWLHDQSASLSNHYDHEGFWNTDIYYDDLALGDDNYRIQGRVTLYLVGSQRSRSFNVYLKAEAGRRPPGSSIDWGINN